MVEAIMLAAAIFWDSKFALCPRYTLNVARKLGLKTRRLKAKVINERIRKIWANKTIAELDLLFTNDPEWWRSTAIIFAQPKNKNIK